MSLLYLDLEYGISGDMFVSALSDLGIDFQPLEKAFNSLGLGVKMKFVKETRNGIQGKRADFSWDYHQPLRLLREIRALLHRMPVSEKVKDGSTLAFERLAGVEAMVHGMDVDQVHFHEVGALDTLMDIVGAFWGLEQMGVGRVSASTVPWFCGKVQTAHGELPLPAPATAMLLKNKKIKPSDYHWEIITPTGALILDQLVQEYSSGFRGILRKSGTGFGEKKAGFNGLRAFLAETEEIQDKYEQDKVWLLTTNIDHLTGEELGVFLESMMQAGALDVIHLPGTMKKNRPGCQVQVLCRPDKLGSVQDAFFKYSLTLGVRMQLQERILLPRRSTGIKLKNQDVQAKEIFFDGRSYVRPEMNDLLNLSHRCRESVVQIRLSGEGKPDG
ncbi:LarC family nickel insertion protein [Desulfonatronospira sp.]|uniref:LarC family nickel insertion protein n=1 Tax=Desulfonatronospira sp. TaxID=1962951 RepID=UPI0025B98EE0|nr:LarC family nickel insertion protein [Desulfonatronospira sp.]